MCTDKTQCSCKLSEEKQASKTAGCCGEKGCHGEKEKGQSCCCQQSE